MRWRWRILIAAVLLLVVLPVVAAGTGWFWLRNGLPSYRGTLTLEGLSAPVRIDRDAHAIPRIVAASMPDAYRALGYLHAQDRLWQMDMTRRLGAGRTAEIVPSAGREAAVRFDRSARTLGLYRLAESSFAALPAEVQAALEAYAAGVNAYLAHRREPLPLEFQLLRYQPEPWRPADSVVWGKLMALQLSANLREEVLRARLLSRLTPAQVEDLYPPEPIGVPTTLAAAAPTGPGPAAGPTERADRNAPDDQIALADLAELATRVWAALPPAGPATASNEWAISGGKTASGKPILANDPHLSLQAPVLWYLARIETPELTLSGATVPGVPFHLLGHNGTIAWGITTTGSDTQDVFVEKLDPADAGRYLTPGGPRYFDSRTEIIKVRGQPDQSLTIRATRHGPVLPEGIAFAGVPPTPGQVLALAFTGLGDRDTTTEAIYRINRARSWEQFRSALRVYQTPQQNLVYADTAGTIGFIAPGLVPIRRKGNGQVPVPGWSGEYDWSGTIPFEALPQAVDPPSQRFINANNAVVGADYPHRLAVTWPESFRGLRITSLIDQGGRASVSASVTIQQDVVSLPARLLLPLMLPREGSDTASLSRAAQAAVALLRRWDGTAARDRPEPLIFSWWLREFNRGLFADWLGPLFPEYWGLHPRVVERVLTQAPGWCDRAAEPGTRTCTDLLRATLETTIRTLADRYGENPTRWRWGREHPAPMDHPLLSQVPLLGSLIAIGVEADGDGYTVSQASSRISDDRAPFADVHGPGLRAVYDLANLDQSLFMISTGQSGNPLSPFYRDLVQSWRDGAMLLIAPSADTTAVTTMVLTPQAP